MKKQSRFYVKGEDLNVTFPKKRNTKNKGGSQNGCRKVKICKSK